MKNRFISKLVTMFMVGTLVFSGMSVQCFAEEETAVEEAALEGQELEALDGYEEGEIEDPAANVVMSGIEASNGREIAASYPDSVLPAGFHKSSCTYEGQNIEIANMDNDSTGEVILAYLADSDGSNGDFYLCEMSTAVMSDFVQIENGKGGFLVVLDPGDVVVAPSGFTRHSFKFGQTKKILTGWSLPAETKEETTEAEDSDKEAFANPFAPVEVRADEVGGLDNDMEVEDGEEEVAAEEEAEEETEAAEVTSGKAAEDGSGIVSADPSDFVLFYGINDRGDIGFYLYDHTTDSYLRYVDIDNGDKATLDQYKKDLNVRLIVIAVLGVVVVILIFVIINILVAKRDEYDDDDDDDISSVRKKVANRRKRSSFEDDEEDEIFERPVRRRPAPEQSDQPQRRPAPGQGQPQRRPAPGQGQPQRRPAPGQGQAPRRPAPGQGQPQRRPAPGPGQAPRRPAPGQGAQRRPVTRPVVEDDDLDFEFLNLK